MASASRKKTLSPNTSWAHCERVWINGARNARAVRNLKMHCTSCTPASWENQSSDWEGTCQKLRVRWWQNYSCPLHPTRKDSTRWDGTRRETQLGHTEQSSVAEMVQRVPECSTKCKKCRIKQRAKTGSGDRLVSKVLPHKHGVLSSNTQDTFKPHKAAML